MDIETREDQPYAAVRATVTLETFAKITDRFPEVMQWLADRELPALGAPFFRYSRVTGEEYEVEAAIPTVAEVPAAGEVFTATLPGGRYAVEVHEGHPDGLIAVTERILADESLRFDRDGDRWGARLETFFTDPAVEPDPARWTTEVASASPTDSTDSTEYADRAILLAWHQRSPCWRIRVAGRSSTCCVNASGLSVTSSTG